MDVSIIIVNYNTLQMTSECIDSLCRQTNGIDFEIILVDNGSTDGSRKHFESDSRITYIYNEENLGFGKANNLGYKHSHGKYIFLLNSDTLLLNNAIHEFFQFMEQASPTVACCGCQLVDISNKPTHSAGRFPGIYDFSVRVMSFTFYELCRKINKEKEFERNSKVDYVTGADLFIRREVVEKCGMFDPDFFMYFEETEMQNRFHKAGYDNMIILTPKIKHLVGGSYKRVGHSLSGLIREMESRYIYCKKVHSSIKYHIIAILHLLMIPRILICRAPYAEKIMLAKIIFFNL